jgi:glycosyltransferase involved in cell wall biosynthesis
MRKKYGLPEAAFIPALVGRNNHNKGALRLHSALDGLPGVKAMFIGEGMGGLAGDQVAMTGQAEHDLLPEYLSCADVFVLPSLREGCNNAIQEALACGLPVVSSDRAFNREILRPEFAVLIDPLDVTAIRVMVRRLKDDSALRAGMSRAALEFTRTHNLANRAKGIIHWMTGFLHDTNGSGERPGSTAMTDIRT